MYSVQKDAQTRSSAHNACCEPVVVEELLTRRCMPMVVTVRRRKSRPRLPVDDDESDGAQADEEPLAGSRVRMGLVNIDTGTTRRRSVLRGDF